jgi:glutaredoxin
MITLYINRGCPSCRAVANYLIIKNIPFEMVEVGEEQVVPTLEIDGQQFVGYNEVASVLLSGNN